MTDQHKLHPLAMLLFFFKIIKNSIWLVISGAIFIGSFDINELLPDQLQASPVMFVSLFLLVIIIVFGFISWLKWQRLRYMIHPDALQITQGIIVRHDRTIKTKNIHSMNVNQHIFHQVFNLANLKIETAGSDVNVDGELKAIDFELARRLKYQFTNDLPLDDVTAFAAPHRLEDDKEDWRSSIYRLLAAGATTGRIGTLLAIAFVLPTELSSYLPADIYQASELWVLKQSIVVWVILVTLYLIFMIAIGVVSFMLKYGQFTLRREGDYLIVKHGLIEKKETQLHINRIQAITFKQNLFRMPFGWYGCYVDFAGGEFDAKAEGRLLLYPLLRRREVTPFLKQWLPEYDLEDMALERTESISYFYRMIRFSLLVLIPSSIFFFFYVRWWLILTIASLLFVRAGCYYFEYRLKGYATRGAVLRLEYLYRFSRCLTLVKRKHMLELNRIETPVMKKLQVCHLKFAVMNNFVGQHFNYRWISESQMNKLTDWFHKKNNER
ncbi:Uncharacterized membrane protein YdbT, contains bPH2 (pleckstrin homology) domain [Halolactibacillus halophilus]|uniref:Membrane protein n=1 Tax=Halolactibacillus halophilus TaxID=306540 RepID=A0A1I5SND0_9BACI|nr:PH domain-containing protein [Halolactibacillus halophilus]GEM02620.1 membrane protein [Halolactibacillus halophilus]SFP72027.1 Uncharacterized membrane protein YdbT, contains bPH2 (pleckstrin homology) domain [Halolactibacillus halophilus]